MNLRTYLDESSGGNFSAEKAVPPLALQAHAAGPSHTELCFLCFWAEQSPVWTWACDLLCLTLYI